MKIYVASSWRNDLQPYVVEALRAAGHDVYDFKNPAEGDEGFHWTEVAEPGTNWKTWSPVQFRIALEHPIARRGFASDMNALQGCDACVLVLPCGKSAHLELGYAAAVGKVCFVLAETSQLGGSSPKPPTEVSLRSTCEPELMYRMLTPPYVLLSIEEVVEHLKRHELKKVGVSDFECKNDDTQGKGWIRPALVGPDDETG